MTQRFLPIVMSKAHLQELGGMQRPPPGQFFDLGTAAEAIGDDQRLTGRLGNSR
jgi:hypothetical protein